jgi:hypothetical protein
MSHSSSPSLNIDRPLADTSGGAKWRRKTMRYNFALALPVMAALLATTPSVQAQTLDPATAAAAEEEFAATLGCTKQRAAAVALKAVDHGARVLFVILDRQDRPVHWSVDLVNSTREFEVWVNTACKEIKIISQPR